MVELNYLHFVHTLTWNVSKGIRRDTEGIWKGFHAKAFVQSNNKPKSMLMLFELNMHEMKNICLGISSFK